MSRHARTIAPLIVAVCVLGGCGGTTKTVIVQGAPAPASTSTTTQSTTATSSVSATPDAAPKSFVHLEAFQTPTGNIGCMIVGGMARCDIVRRSWSLPSRPASCPHIVDFGQGLEVGRSGAARFVCAGDTARDPSSSRLAYGTASQVGVFVCVSRATGMTCTSRSSGHGFLLSVQRYRLF